jgi:pimeloyl-ACP methyl ester carboxylesterase
VVEQREACRAWSDRRADAHDGDAVASATPVLIIAGTLDPVSPPSVARETARTLSASRLVFVPAGHVPHGACVTAIERAFLAAPNPGTLDTACVAQTRFPSFRF